MFCYLFYLVHVYCIILVSCFVCMTLCTVYKCGHVLWTGQSDSSYSFLSTIISIFIYYNIYIIIHYNVYFT